MIRTTLLTAALSALVPSLAAAEPSYTVDPAVPFTAHDLAEAVQLRTDARVEVRVTRVGNGLLVEVGGARQVVEVNTGDPHDTARVVALVVVSLVEVAPVVVREETPGVPAPAHTGRSLWSMRAAAGLSRDDGGTFSAPVTGAASYEIAPFARLVGSLTLMKATAPERGSLIAPIRLGVEGRAGALGIELGGMGVLQRTCTGGATIGKGGYGTGRVYLPISERTNAIVEVGGYYMLSQATGCFDTMTLSGEAYGGHVGAGVEWRL